MNSRHFCWVNSMKNRQKPAIRFKGFTEDWEQRKVGDYVDITTGKLDANAMKEDGKYDFYTSGIQKYKIDVSAFEGPAITIAGNGATVGYMHLADGKFNAYQRTYVLTDFQADRHFLFFEIGNKLPKKITQEARTGNIPYIVMDMLTNLQIVIPEKSEQEKIGQYIQQLDNLITLHQRKYDKLVNIKKSMLEKMFPREGKNVPDIRFSGFTEDWEQRKLGEISLRESTIVESSDNNPSVEYEDVVSDEGRLNKDIQQKDKQKNGIAFNSSHILYGKLRPYLHNWLNPDFNGAAVGDWWVLKPNTIDKNFLYRLIQTEQFDNVANQSSGSKMPRADWNLVSNAVFAIPHSIAEQSKIAKIFTNLDNLITLHQRKLEKLKYIKKSCLEKMFI